MSKCYELLEEAGKLVFKPASADAPEYVINGDPPPASDGSPVLAARLGDPDLLSCAVYRDKNGGFFSVRDAFGPLFVGAAASNLVYALALARFGKMVADARYGADIYENPEYGDD